MTVLLTGATGFIGRHIAEALRRRGDAVRCLVRRPEQAPPLRALGGEIVAGDLTTPDTLRGAARGVEAVIHAAGLVGDWGSRRDFAAANEIGTRHLLDALEPADRPRLVHLSSVSVYGRRQGLGLTEDTPLEPGGHPYGDTKIAAERLVWERHQADRVRATAIRPCIVYGPYDWKFVPKLARALKAGRVPLLDGAQHRAPIVNVHDVVTLVLACLDRDEAIGHAFNCASPEPISWRHLFEEVAGHVGARAPQRSVPLPLAYAAGAVMEGAWKLARARRPPLVTRFGVRLAGMRVVYDIQKAERILGFRPRVSLAEGLPETIEWMKRAPEEPERG
jgi:nucleoside-diphosphate-sugar epimerase